jgi:hypothetical protein
MTHVISYFLVFGLLALSHMAVAGPDRGKPTEFIIRAEGDMLTLKATSVSQRRLLEGLAKQLNFELIVAGPLDESRSLDIDGRPWEEALKKALAPDWPRFLSFHRKTMALAPDIHLLALVVSRHRPRLLGRQPISKAIKLLNWPSRALIPRWVSCSKLKMMRRARWH